MTPEVGVAHSDRSGRWWLVVALEPLTLVGGRDGVLETRHVRTASLEPRRGVDVEALCERWKVTVEALDAATRPWFAPVGEARPRRRHGEGRARHSKAARDAELYEARLHRMGG